MNKDEALLKMKDPKFYLENFCKIKVKKGGLAPFILNETQKDLFNTLNHYNRVMLLKARQLGSSTGVTGYFYHNTIMNPGITTALIGYNMTMVAELLDKVKVLYNSTPAKLRPKLQYNSKYELSFPDIESKILVLPNSENVGRGYTINNCLVTELSSWEKAEEKMMGLQESVPMDGKIVIESCVAGDTIVLTNNGPIYVEDIHNWDNNKLGFSIGKEIFIDGHYGLKPTNIYYNSGVQKGFKIVTKKGYELKMSSVHKLFILRGQELIFTEAKDLKVGDNLVIKYGQELWGKCKEINWKPTPYGFNKKWLKQFSPNKINSDLSYLLGLILGDGYIDFKQGRVVITTIDEEISDFLKNNNLELKFLQSKGDDYFHYICKNSSFVEFLKDFIGFKPVKARYKEIPKIIFSWERENIISFLRGLFDTDGCCDRGGIISFTSTSKKIINVLQSLLLNFGIICSVYSYNAKPSKKVKVWSSGYKLKMSGGFSKIFLDKIGFRIKRKQQNRKDGYDYVGGCIPGIGKVIKKQMKELGLKFSDISRGLNKGFFSKTGNITYKILNRILEKCKKKESKEYKELKKLYNYKYYYNEIKEIISTEENVYDFTVNNGHTVIYNGFVGHQTPRGSGNLYHRMWMTKNEYIKKEYGWWWGYSAKEMQAKRISMGPMAFSQEYELEFLTSGRSVFDPMIIRKQRKNILKVGDERIINGEKFIVYEKDGWVIYKEPEVGGLYVIGGDVAEGVSGGDYSVAIIWDRKTGEEVTMYRGLIAPDRFGEILNQKGREYNNALMIVEVNNHGLTTLTILKQKLYPSMYFRPAKYETVEARTSDRMGWRTTKITRPLLIDDFAQAIREELLTIHSKILLDEMSVFIYNDSGDMVSQTGFNNDTIFAAGISLQGFKILYDKPLTQLDERNYLPKSFSY